MLQRENQTQSANFKWACQALSAAGEPCNTSATCHCGVCGKWFYSVHAEDGARHCCAFEPGEEMVKDNSWDWQVNALLSS